MLIWKDIMTEEDFEEIRDELLDEKEEDGELSDADQEILDDVENILLYARGDYAIKTDYFEEYMDELVEDCYDFHDKLPSFVSYTIDYKALAVDYSLFEIGDETYYIHA